MPKTNEIRVNVNNSNIQSALYANEIAVVLNKKSSESEIKRYFEVILQLSNTSNEYPVNLDLVWALAYAEKGVAVKALKKNFIEGIDYISFDQNVKREKGGSVATVYMLSVPCLEYFIARKVRPVFEVYRQVFHKAVKKEITYTPREVRKLVNDAEHRASEAIAVAKELAKSSASMRSQYTTITRLYQDELLMKINLLSFIELHNLTNELNNYLK